MEQLPGPRGSPQVPHGPAAARGAASALALTAKTDNCLSSASLEQDGQVAFRPPWTIASKACWQSRQTYSKMGMTHQ
jgi:hypothetical protein